MVVSRQIDQKVWLLVSPQGWPSRLVFGIHWNSEEASSNTRERVPSSRAGELASKSEGAKASPSFRVFLCGGTRRCGPDLGWVFSSQTIQSRKIPHRFAQLLGF